MAARRERFAAGAEEESEEVDWSAAAVGGGSDDEANGAGGAEGDGAAEAAAAARVLDAVRHDAGDEEDEADAAATREPSWEDLEGFVPPGTAGFNAFAREQMRKAGVPSNARVLPADELAPAEWVGQPVKPRLQPCASGRLTCL